MASLAGKSVMVTGGAGFIGSHLVDRVILDEPSNLVVVDNFFLGKESNLEQARSNFPSLKVLDQDVKDYDVMKQIITDENIEVIFNLAVVPLPASLPYPRWTFEENMSIVLSLLEILRERNSTELIHFSSSEVYGTSIYAPMDEDHPLNGRTPYAVSKAASDQLILAYRHLFNVSASIVRPFNNYGPRQNDKGYAGVIPITIRRIQAGEAPVIYGDGKQTRDYIFVTDTADAAVEIYKADQLRGRVLNIGTGIETDINTIVSTIARHMNCSKPVVYQEVRPGDVRRHIANIFLAKELINLSPGVGLEEGLKKTVEWYTELDRVE